VDTSRPARRQFSNAGANTSNATIDAYQDSASASGRKAGSKWCACLVAVSQPGDASGASEKDDQKAGSARRITDNNPRSAA
jgi:hypothetical protein